MKMVLKKSPLTIRRCPAALNAALVASAANNRRSKNNEALVWLERQAPDKTMTGREVAALLRDLAKGSSAEDRRQRADAIEQIRRASRRERLH